MENNLPEKVKSTTDLAVKEYKPKLINALQTGNKQEMAIILKDYKLRNGAANFPALLSIPSTERLPMLWETQPQYIFTIITAALTLSFESMNLSRGMTSSQIADLSEAILDSSSEDNLSVEDVVLFLQKLIRGEYGKLYESMDIPKFMEKFELYREERFKSLMNLRDEEISQHKALTPYERTDSRQQHKEAKVLSDFFNYKK